MRHPVTDIALLAYIARKNASVISYSEATKACKSSSSASRVLHQLIGEGLLDPQPKLLGLRYVTRYVVTPKGKQVANLALQLTRLRETAARIGEDKEVIGEGEEQQSNLSAKAEPHQPAIVSEASPVVKPAGERMGKKKDRTFGGAYRREPRRSRARKED